MKALYAIIFTFSFGFIQAQVENRTETDCNSESRSIYNVLESGMPIIIASKGFDCSICVGQADDLADFADEHSGEVAIWGAMTYRYSSATPTCSDVNTWVNTHDWDNVFTFPDVDEYWVTFGVPYYYLIDPATQEIVYEGPSFTTASNQALGLVAVNTLNLESIVEDMILFAEGDNLNLSIGSEIQLNTRLELYNILGQKLFEQDVQLIPGINEFNIPFISNEGIYIASLISENESFSRKFLVQKN